MISNCQHSPEVWLIYRTITLQSRWIQENKLCQPQIINHDMSLGKSSPYPHCPTAFPHFSLGMRCPKKKWTITCALIISCFIIPYRWLLRRKPQLRCYYPILAEHHSDQDPFLASNTPVSVTPCKALGDRSEDSGAECMKTSPVIYAQTETVMPWWTKNQ
jgi:hypothetical protein